jgi:hypothetical protein
VGVFDREFGLGRGIGRLGVLGVGLAFLLPLVRFVRPVPRTVAFDNEELRRILRRLLPGADPRIRTVEFVVYLLGCVRKDSPRLRRGDRVSEDLDRLGRIAVVVLGEFLEEMPLDAIAQVALTETQASVQGGKSRPSGRGSIGTRARISPRPGRS